MYQETKLTLDKFDEEWLVTEPAQATIWFTNLISELAAKPYYHPLLTADKQSINYDAPTTGPNTLLFSVLMSKLTGSFHTMCINCKATTGMAVLHLIDTGNSKIQTNKAISTTAVTNFYKLQWDPTKQTLTCFNDQFNTLYHAINQSDNPPPFLTVKDVWICALPGEFTDLKSKYNKQQLDTNWSEAETVINLWFETMLEIKNCNIELKKNKKADPNDNKEKKKIILNLKNAKAVKDSKRGEYPSEHPLFQKLLEHIKSLADSGKSRTDVENTFKAAYEYPSCWLCRLKPYHDLYHPSNKCPLLKSTFNAYTPHLCSTVEQSSNTVGTSRSTKRKPRSKGYFRHHQVPSSVTPTRMCYDTGTSPKSLCSKREYFRDLILYPHPKLIALADPDTTAPVIGQGTLHIIINNTHQIWIFAYLTKTTDTLLSAVDHLSYQDYSITGAFGKIQISFLTFTFEVSRSKNFEFNILPGKSSNKPVVWQPQLSKRIDRHVSKELIKLQ